MAEPFDDLLDHLGNAIKREGQGLDILAFQRRHKGPAKLLGDLLRDALVLPARVDEIVDLGRSGRWPASCRKRPSKAVLARASSALASRRSKNLSSLPKSFFSENMV